MKLFIYNYRPYDEGEPFARFAAKYGVELSGFCCDPATADNAALAAGCEYVILNSTPLPAPAVEAFARLGVKMLVTRSIGYDHIDLARAQALGLRVSNVSYSPDCVADYTVLLILMAIRRMKRILQRAAIHDYTLEGLIGGELHNASVGIVGAGSIGRSVLRDLSGFGCKLFYYSNHRSEDAERWARYLPFDELLRTCNVLSLHLPLTEQTFHLIDRAAIEKMPDGAVLVNTARGGLVDTEALIDALERGKLGACALDVIENEAGLVHFDRKCDTLKNHSIAILQDMPNAVLTPHMAFYTDQSTDDGVENAIKSCLLDRDGKENPWRIL